jgi:hypothetical protein
MRTAFLFALCALCATTSIAQDKKARLKALVYDSATPDKVRLVAMDSLIGENWKPTTTDSLLQFYPPAGSPKGPCNVDAKRRVPRLKKRLEEMTRPLETLAALGRARIGADGWTYI